MRSALILSFFVLLGPVVRAATPPDLHLRGSLEIHDPSTVVKHKDMYYVFGTGRNIVSKQSPDHVYWTNGPSLFAAPPSWTVYAVPGFQDTFWAPDVIYAGGRWCLYYSVSTWGSQVSAIGLATNPTLDSRDPNYRWTDQGMVIQSSVGSPYNTIDPSVLFDAVGNLWMVFGSYWNGIYLVQLDAATGKRIAPNSPTYRLAHHSSIEASNIRRQGEYYYLFVNWGSCCAGVNSTYHIRVGRSRTITGPYVDRDGVNLANGGGSLFMESSGKYSGPGHAAFFTENAVDYLSYHYYDSGAWSSGYRAYGPAKFDIVPLGWDAAGWPTHTNDWKAEYEFQRDALDSGGQYTGLLRGSAAITNTPDGLDALALSGTNAYAQLPPGVAYARTFSALVKWNGGPAWQRIFDFGNDTSSYVMLTPSSGAGKLQCDIRAKGSTQSIVAPQPLQPGVWTHVAATFEGEGGGRPVRGVLYVGGLPVATNATLTLVPQDVRAQTNHLGKSRFAADPNFNGQIASFRAYGRALTRAELVAPNPSIQSPVGSERFSPGDQIPLIGSAADFMGRELPPENLSWLVEHVTASGSAAAITAGIGRSASFTIPASGEGATNGYYRIQLRATDSLGRAGIREHFIRPNSRPVSGAAPTSFYPFERDATDLLGGRHGTLVGGATVGNDPRRGSVLRLSGAGAYAALPPQAGEGQDFHAWVAWNGGGAWQRVFDFGRDTQRYFFLTPANGVGRLQCAITGEARAYVHIIEAASPPVSQWTHVAVSLNGLEGRLYLDGRLTAVNNSVNVLPSDFAPTRNYLGKSQFPTDPYFNGRIDSARLDLWTRSRSELPFNGISEVGLRMTRQQDAILLEWQKWVPLYAAISTNLSSGWLPLEANMPELDNHYRILWPTEQTASAFFRLTGSQ